MFNKKIVVCWLVVFVTMMVYGFAVFGIALESFYQQQLPNISMRSEGEELMHWLALGQLIMAYGFVWIWSQLIIKDGIGVGLKFGFFMGIFWAGVELINLAFMPMTVLAACVSYFADVVMMMVAGAVLSVTWQKFAD